MKIFFINKQKKYKISEIFCKKIINSFISKKITFDHSNHELFVNFISKHKIKILKKEIFGLDIATDVISIPIDSMDTNDDYFPKIFGEIFICPEVASRNSVDYNHSFEDEIMLLLVHGLLHLIGFCDEKYNDILVMRNEEKKMINFIKKEIF